MALNFNEIKEKALGVVNSVLNKKNKKNNTNSKIQDSENIENAESIEVNNDNIADTGVNQEASKKKKKKKNNKIVWIVCGVIVAVVYLMQDGSGEQTPQEQQAKNQTQTESQKLETDSDISQKELELAKIRQEEKRKQLEKLEQEEFEKLNSKINAFDKEPKNIDNVNVKKEVTEQKADNNTIDKEREAKLKEEELKNEEIKWQKRVLSSFGDTDKVYFLLDQNKPSIISNNFRQEADNQYIIANSDGIIDAIYFEVNNSGFLDVVLRIKSTDNKFQLIKKYNVLNYAKLHFFSDSVVYENNDEQTIVVENNFIFPYLKIEKVSKEKDGRNYIIFSVYQKGFGKDIEDLTFKYYIK